MAFSNKYIFFFTMGVCLVCSLAVSALAVVLKERQAANKLLDKNKNIIRVAQLVEPATPLTEEVVNGFFERGEIEAYLVDRNTGEKIVDDSFDPESYNMKKLVKDLQASAEASTRIAGLARVRRIPHQLLVYEIKQPGKEGYVLSVHGAGLWSTLRGFLYVKVDGKTIGGLTFYEHMETPGLGGEVDNPNWKAQWPGKKIYGPDGKPKVNVKKGGAQDRDYEVDGISGSTLTCNGVTYLVQLWLGEEGYQLFLQKYGRGG